MSTLWQDYRDKYKLMEETRGKCRCIGSSMGTWLRLRLNKGATTTAWFVATHMDATVDKITLLRYDMMGLQWQISTVPGTDNAMVRLVGVVPGMVGAREHTNFLARKLNEEY